MMAGFDNIKTSDQLFCEEETLVRAIANLLQFNYISSPVSPGHIQQNLSAPRNSHSILKHVYRSLPCSPGFPAWDHQLSLVCITSMSKGIFGDYVAEAFGLKSDAMSWFNNHGVIVQLLDISGLPMTLPHLNTLRLVYTQRNWSDFDASLTILDDPNIREDGPLAKAYDSQDISRLLSTLAESAVVDEGTLVKSENSEVDGHDRASSQKFFGLFRGTHLRFRHWARCVGILGGQFHMLTDEILLYLFIGALDEVLNSSIYHSDEAAILTAVMNSNYLLYPRKMLCAFGGRLSVQCPSGFAIDPISSEATRAFTTAVKTLDCDNMPEWAGTARKAFLDNHESFIRLDARCWAPKARAEFAKTLPEILVRLQTHFRNGNRRVLVSIWPYSVALPEYQEAGESVYVLGVYRFNDERPADAEYLDSMCQQYMLKLRYDRSSASLDCGLADNSEVATLLRNSSAEQESMLSTPSLAQTTQALAKLNIESAKFRKASAAMDRLRWDPKHAALDYEVGYVDRFEKDLMWKSLDRWEKMTEEEEFVPEHRIQKIRRKSGGVVVWDREKRFDGTGGG